MMEKLGRSLWPISPMSKMSQSNDYVFKWKQFTLNIAFGPWAWATNDGEILSWGTSLLSPLLITSGFGHSVFTAGGHEAAFSQRVKSVGLSLGGYLPPRTKTL